MADKALTVEDLIAWVPGEDNVAYPDYWVDPEPELLSYFRDKYEINLKCTGECQVCQITHIEKYREKYSNSPSKSIKLHNASGGKRDYTHAWQIACPFIPKDYDDLVPPAVRQHMTDEDMETARLLKDPTAFAAKYFNWHARKHQELMLRCQSKKKVLRWGRRAGKTEAFAIEILWHAFTKNVLTKDPITGATLESGLKILVVAPFESQVINMFEMLMRFINKNEETKNSVVVYRKSPHHHLEFENGCTIKGFTTGANEAASIRGQDAHIIVLDECDYMSEGDYKTVMPIASSHPNVLVRASSTPKGKRERFWKWSTQNPQWKEFHFPSAVIDRTPFEQTRTSWKQMRREMRPEYSHDEWLQEIMAIFIASASGVYQPRFVTDAMKDYTYADMVNAHAAGELVGWRYTVGVDWNSNVGTEICVLGLAITAAGPLFRVMEAINVPKQDFTQYKGLKRLTEVFQQWKPEYVYVDAGHGATNWEMLRIWCQQQAPGSYERSLEDRIKKFEFGGKVEIRDPITQQKIKHPAKAYMVENSVRKFEDHTIEFSKDDDKLRKQLLNYIVQSRGESGKPIYGFENKEIGDHALDALNLSLVAWAREEGIMAYSNLNIVTDVSVLGSSSHRMFANEQSGPEYPSYSGISSRRALADTLSSRAEAISARNGKMYGDTHEGMMYAPGYEETKDAKPGFLDDTEHLYAAKRSNRKVTSHISRRKKSWRSRSNF